MLRHVLLRWKLADVPLVPFELDIADAFRNLKVAEEERKYLNVRVECEGEVHSYQHSRVPFGTKGSPLQFCKLSAGCQRLVDRLLLALKWLDMVELGFMFVDDQRRLSVRDRQRYYIIAALSALPWYIVGAAISRLKARFPWSNFIGFRLVCGPRAGSTGSTATTYEKIVTFPTHLSIESR